MLKSEATPPPTVPQLTPTVFLLGLRHYNFVNFTHPKVDCKVKFSNTGPGSYPEISELVGANFKVLVVVRIDHRHVKLLFGECITICLNLLQNGASEP